MSLVCYCIKKSYDKLTGQSYYSIYKKAADPHRPLKDFATLLINVFAGIVAACIAWKRNEHEGLFTQVLISVLAFFFGALYLIYFVGFVLINSQLFRKSYMIDLNEDALDKLAMEADKLSNMTKM